MIAAPIPSVPTLGVAEARCVIGDFHASVIVTAVGLKDRQGRLRVEVYPADPADFLADDNLLVAAGKTFRRAEIQIPQNGPAQVCVRLPGSGTYTMAVIHDRDSNRKFGALYDGIGFPGDPRLDWSKPTAAAASFVASSGVTSIRVTLNYRRGLASFGPIKGLRP